MTRAFLLFAAVLGSLAVAAARADADSLGTLQVNGTLLVKFGAVDCAAGTPATTKCFGDVPLRGDVVAGLGEVTFAPTTLYWDNYGSPCGHVHVQIPILVAGKGEIDLAVAVTGCWTGDNFPPAAVTVSGGSGRYAGASGSGVLEFHTANITGPLAGNRNVTWTGTLDVAGVTFDTTPPQITGATSRVVKTRLAAGKRVRYSVSAADATDGPVPAACLPNSGSLFRVRRTTVTCTAVDGSGNTATARFVITVKRVRQ
jgi:HYR domain-containing protein